MSRHDDVMVANGVGEEIRRLALVSELYDLLRTAKVWLRLVANQHSFSDEMA